MPKVGIIISNYNGWQDTLVCLEILQRQTFTDFEIILIDDASPNDSVAQLQDKLPPNTVFLPQQQNVGVAPANNIAIRRALADGCDFALLLNNDTAARPDFLETYNNYTNKTNFYDFRLVSTLGLTDEDLSEVKKMDGVKLAEGAVGADFLFNTDDEDNLIMMAQSIPENVNQIKLKAGRMPEKANECLADPNMYSEKDIGSTIKLSKDNSEQTFDTFAYDEYTIVGLAYSVLYINMERGSSTLGNGSVKGYIYIPMF